MISVTFTRDALSLPDLVIGDDPFAGNFHIPEDGVTRPDFKMRRAYAADNPLFAGRQMLAAVPDAGTLPLKIYAHGATTAALNTARAVLDAAATQWAFTVTVTVDGQSETWDANPEFPEWGVIDLGMARAFMARCSLVLPVNPVVP